MQKHGKKIAIIYDWIDKWGGVERMLITLHELFPTAVFYTSYYDKQTAPWAQELTIKQSFLSRFPAFIKHNRFFSLLFFPYIFESFDLTGYDNVISITSAFAKSVITKPETNHISIVLTPPRYIWNDTSTYLSSFQRNILLPIIHAFREWDFIASRRPDTLYSISKAVQQRVRNYYQIESEILYPPFDLDYWHNVQITPPDIHLPSSYYLVVSRLEPYKKVDLVIEAFKKLKQDNLIIVGSGSLKNELSKHEYPNITFLQSVDDMQLAYIYSHAQALIMAQEEEFGYVALEAQFYNCPVIAYKSGGAQETVLDNKTGIFFSHQNSESLVVAIENYKKISYTLKNYLKKNAFNHLKKFSKDTFNKHILKLL
jgi:glycosyltransferase involved in cell wall biosynthesis